MQELLGRKILATVSHKVFDFFPECVTRGLVSFPLSSGVACLRRGDVKAGSLHQAKVEVISEVVGFLKSLHPVFERAIDRVLSRRFGVTVHHICCGHRGLGGGCGFSGCSGIPRSRQTKVAENVTRRLGVRVCLFPRFLNSTPEIFGIIKVTLLVDLFCYSFQSSLSCLNIVPLRLL